MFQFASISYIFHLILVQKYQVYSKSEKQFSAFFNSNNFLGFFTPPRVRVGAFSSEEKKCMKKYKYHILGFFDCLEEPLGKSSELLCRCCRFFLQSLIFFSELSDFVSQFCFLPRFGIQSIFKRFQSLK